MAKNSQTSNLPNLQAQRQPVPLTPVAARLKEQLSHIPLWKQKEKESGNDFWNALASSHINL